MQTRRKYKMYIPTLLSILALPLVVECHSWWNIMSDILETTFTPEDARLNISQLTYKYGYDFQEHKLETEDSYIINVHRIPNENGQVVLLMHGITESSDSWVLQGPHFSLGYVLADAGFDVWMGNARGNKYSMEHATYSSELPKFWSFTWEQIGLYDLSAMIDYILKTTGRESLYYIGHSQGTTSSYVLLSMKPEYNQKIKLVFSLAPVAWMGHVKSPIIQMFSPTTKDLQGMLDHSVFSSGTVLFHKYSPLLCKWLPIKCENFLYALIGYENKINSTFWPIIFGHMPTGSSTLQLVHYGQLVKSNRFCRFDHGENGNLELYGKTTPANYDIDKIVAPIVLFFSDKDWLSDTQDVMKLKSKLPNVLDDICLDDFGHMDYVYATEARVAIYDRIIAQIRKFESDNNVNTPV